MSGTRAPARGAGRDRRRVAGRHAGPAAGTDDLVLGVHQVQGDGGRAGGIQPGLGQGAEHLLEIGAGSGCRGGLRQAGRVRRRAAQLGGVAEDGRRVPGVPGAEQRA